jgi:phenylalanyl-tRNA synthetase beta subunit
VDLVEDVVVAEGYGSFQPEMPHDFTVGKSAPQADLSDRVRTLMVGCGFQELFLPILCSRDDLTTRMRHPDAPSDARAAQLLAAHDGLLHQRRLLRRKRPARRRFHPPS